MPAHPADRAAYDEALLGERGGHGGVCEHCQTALDRIADRAVVLAEGAMVAQGPAKELAQREDLAQLAMGVN